MTMPGMAIVPAYPGITEIVWNEHADFSSGCLSLLSCSYQQQQQIETKKSPLEGQRKMSNYCIQQYMHERTRTLDCQPMAAVLSFSLANSSKQKMQKVSLSWKAPDGTGLMEFGQCHAFAVCPVVDMFLSFRGDCKDLSWMALGCGFKHFQFWPLLEEDFQINSCFSEGLKPPILLTWTSLLLLLPCFTDECTLSAMNVVRHALVPWPFASWKRCSRAYSPTLAKVLTQISKNKLSLSISFAEQFPSQLSA